MQPHASSRNNQPSIATDSSKPVENSLENSAVIPKKGHLQITPSIPSGSQNSLIIDFRQPLQLRLSNGEAVHSSQRVNARDSHLPSQFIQIIATEAAGAAAKSAVAATFEKVHELLEVSKNSDLNEYITFIIL